MSSESERGAKTPLTLEDERRLHELRTASSLADLVGVTGADSEYEAYVEAKREWASLRERDRPLGARADVLPGNSVTVDGAEIHVHGITHADTDAERRYLRERVSRILAAGGTVYTEQGIRSMYFQAVPEVCEMDDYHWAMERCSRPSPRTQLGSLSITEFDGLREDFGLIRSQFRAGVFSIIDSGGGLYGDRFREALGDAVSDVLLSHEHMATGHDFESFRKSRAAATDPGKLPDLHDYYRKAFLPQPVEREWLRRHDPELEIVTHARNERMADYAVYHSDDVEEMHLIVGAAHQPGVTYYLERHRDGYRSLEDFELLG